MIQDAKVVKCSDYSELIWKIRYWDGVDTTFIYSPYDPVYYFTYRVFMGVKGNYFAYIEKILHGRHPNYTVDLSKQNIKTSVRGKTSQELISEVIRVLR